MNSGRKLKLEKLIKIIPYKCIRVFSLDWTQPRLSFFSVWEDAASHLFLQILTLQWHKLHCCYYFKIHCLLSTKLLFKGAEVRCWTPHECSHEFVSCFYSLMEQINDFLWCTMFETLYVVLIGYTPFHYFMVLCIIRFVHGI